MMTVSEHINTALADAKAQRDYCKEKHLYSGIARYEGQIAAYELVLRYLPDEAGKAEICLTS